MALDDTLVRDRPKVHTQEFRRAETASGGELKPWESRFGQQPPALTARDVERLMREPSPQMRTEIAYKIALGYNGKMFNGDEIDIAQDIFRHLLNDSEVNVRRVLAKSLKSNFNLPRDIALRLAHDVVIVAVPMLESSFVLTEDDLIGIVRDTPEPAKLVAIAKRETISRDLSDALIRRKDEHVIYVLLRNKGANIADEPLDGMFDFICKSQTLLDALVQRGGLSQSLAHKLFAVVPDDARRILRKQYHLSYRFVDEMRDSVLEWAATGMGPDMSKVGNIESLVEQLHRKNRLNYITAIRALCRGDLAFFELVMAKLANVPVINARMLMLDQGQLGFQSLYTAARLPTSLYKPVKILFNMVSELTEHGRVKPGDLQKRIIDRIMSSGLDQTVDHMSYLVALMMKDARRVFTVH